MADPDLTLYAGETRYVEIPVTADADPLTDDVDVAFVTHRADPTDSDWHAAGWKPGQTWASGRAVTARILVGPDDLALAAGTYDAVVRVTDSPEQPWMLAGTVKVK